MPTARGGGPVSLVRAVDAIASEQCAHEGMCARLGAGRRFVDAEACRSAFAEDARTKLKTTVCETGYIEPEMLLECLEKIRTGACTAQTEVVCEPSKMCSP